MVVMPKSHVKSCMMLVVYWFDVLYIDEGLNVSIEGDVEAAKVFVSRSPPEANEGGYTVFSPW